MRPDKSDVDTLKLILDSYDQAIFVAAKIEYNAIIIQKVCRAINRLNVLR